MIKSATIFLISALYAFAPAPDLNRGDRPADEAAAGGAAAGGGAGEGLGADADAVPATAGGSFAAVDVFIDSGALPLAAYQFELTVERAEGAGPDGDKVVLVGVEGGEHPAYRDPPYHDTRALWKQGRIVIADFDTGAGVELPRGRTRVARVMVYLGEGRRAGDPAPEYSAKLEVAASEDARPIEASISVSPAKADKEEHEPDSDAGSEGAER